VLSFFHSWNLWSGDFSTSQCLWHIYPHDSLLLPLGDPKAAKARVFIGEIEEIAAIANCTAVVRTERLPIRSYDDMVRYTLQGLILTQKELPEFVLFVLPGAVFLSNPLPLIAHSFYSKDSKDGKSSSALPSEQHLLMAQVDGSDDSPTCGYNLLFMSAPLVRMLLDQTTPDLSTSLCVRLAGLRRAKSVRHAPVPALLGYDPLVEIGRAVSKGGGGNATTANDQDAATAIDAVPDAATGAATDAATAAATDAVTAAATAAATDTDKRNGEEAGGIPAANAAVAPTLDAPINASRAAILHLGSGTGFEIDIDTFPHPEYAGMIGFHCHMRVMGMWWWGPFVADGAVQALLALIGDVQKRDEVCVRLFAGRDYFTSVACPWIHNLAGDHGFYSSFPDGYEFGWKTQELVGRGDVCSGTDRGLGNRSGNDNDSDRDNGSDSDRGSDSVPSESCASAVDEDDAYLERTVVANVFPVDPAPAACAVKLFASGDESHFAYALQQGIALRQALSDTHTHADTRTPPHDPAHDPAHAHDHTHKRAYTDTTRPHPDAACDGQRPLLILYCDYDLQDADHVRALRTFLHNRTTDAATGLPMTLEAVVNTFDHIFPVGQLASLLREGAGDSYPSDESLRAFLNAHKVDAFHHRYDGSTGRSHCRSQSNAPLAVVFVRWFEHQAHLFV
jgi:hypothetical protein